MKTSITTWISLLIFAGFSFYSLCAIKNKDLELVLISLVWGVFLIVDTIKDLSKDN